MRSLLSVQESAREQPVILMESLRPVDGLVLGWLAAGGAVAIAFRSVPQWDEVAVLHVALILGALAVLAWNALRPSSASRFLREAYPLLYLIPMYEGAGQLVHVVTPAVFDSQIVALEREIFGPGLWSFLQRIESRPLTDAMNAFYFLYYVILGLPPVWIYLRGDLPGFRRVVAAVICAFVPCYVLFILVPVEGPRFFLAEQFPEPQRGYVITPYVSTLLAHAGHRGAAFPSSHVAAAIAAFGAGWRADRRLGWILLPLVVGLSLATVYGRYHYPTDVVAGGIVGLCALAVGPRIMRA